MENFERLGGVAGGEFINQLAASVVGGRDGGSMTRKGVVKERLLQIVSVAAQVATGGVGGGVPTLSGRVKNDFL